MSPYLLLLFFSLYLLWVRLDERSILDVSVAFALDIILYTVRSSNCKGTWRLICWWCILYSDGVASTWLRSVTVVLLACLLCRRVVYAPLNFFCLELKKTGEKNRMVCIFITYMVMVAIHRADTAALFLHFYIFRIFFVWLRFPNSPRIWFISYIR